VVVYENAEYEKRSNVAQSQIGSVNKTGSLPFGVREKQKANKNFSNRSPQRIAIRN
jgi:hypothetical protein